MDDYTLYNKNNSVGPLRWTHSLGKLASDYMEKIDKCPSHWKSVHNKPVIEDDDIPFTYDDKMRIVVYPERF